MVVGYHGTQPARHALDRAVDLLQSREGALEVVYVAPLPESVALSPEGLAEVQQGLDEQARVLAEEVYHRLVGEDHAWHFQRRDGAVAAELKAVADDMQRRYADAAEIVIVIGASAHHHHHVAGSVGSSVVRSRTFPALVVPYKGQMSYVSPQLGNSSKRGIMTDTERQTVGAEAAFDRRIALEEVKARLSAISDTLSDSRIDVGELRKDVDELTAITRRIAWLADISTPRPLHLNHVAAL
jgi:nucleotide-binding universal stress UspA family protein